MACIPCITLIASTCAVDTDSIAAAIKEASLHGAILTSPTAFAVACAVEAITLAVAVSLEACPPRTQHHVASPTSPTLIALAKGAVANTMDAAITCFDGTIIRGPTWVTLANTVLANSILRAIIGA